MCPMMVLTGWCLCGGAMALPPSSCQLVDAEPAVLSELDGHRRNLLHYAGCRPSGSVLAWLLARLGEAQARRMAGQRDEEGKTPLLAACDEGSEEAVLQLLRSELLSQALLPQCHLLCKSWGN